ncbi:putative alpha/beta hydrolase [Frankia canadensis]|uniref:Putative alpha/beta hydrolase n=1 Tax=Frankia canadensis TaxID=1836972 RepID=A0A2I2KRH5_9ACTN|nr:alpha/beta fold hydrolase [Frankia canadensis]SNQ48249.1 putative alpha/beta hydrolase [Frankia canadensis]SOU55539.1 putative alpha/beta hydrolase [Frankia canadensis]
MTETTPTPSPIAADATAAAGAAPAGTAPGGGKGRDGGEFAALESITVPSEGGVSFVLRVLPADDPAAPVVLILPAMALKAKFYLPIAKALRAAGLSVVTTDLRAQGEARPGLHDQPTFGYRELIEVDLPRVLAAVASRFPGVRPHLFCHSLGGQVGLLHAAAAAGEARATAGRDGDGGGQVAGVCVIGTGTVYWKAFGWRRWAEALYSIQTIGLVARVRGYWPGGMLIGGAMPGRVMTDWARHSRTSRYRPRGTTRDYDRLLAELDIPVLAISLDEDRLGPKSNVDFLCGRMPNARLDRWHITAASGVAHRDHFAWVKDAAVIGPAVAAWIRERRVPGTGPA